VLLKTDLADALTAIVLTAGHFSIILRFPTRNKTLKFRIIFVFKKNDWLPAPPPPKPSSN